MQNLLLTMEYPTLTGIEKFLQSTKIEFSKESTEILEKGLDEFRRLFDLHFGSDKIKYKKRIFGSKTIDVPTLNEPTLHELMERASLWKRKNPRACRKLNFEIPESTSLPIQSQLLSPKLHVSWMFNNH